MDQALKQILESNLLTDDVKEGLKEAWDAKCQQYRTEVKEELRQEFAALYKRDKQILVNSMDKFLNEAVNRHATELAEQLTQVKADKDKLNRAIQEVRKTYKVRMEEHKATLKTFMLGQLKEELTPMAGDYRDMQKQRVKLAQSINEEKAKAKAQLREQANELKTFVMGKLEDETTRLSIQKEELAKEKVAMAKKLREERTTLKEAHKARLVKIQNFMLEHMIKELKEFQIDKKDLAEAKVRLFKEHKAQLDEAKKEFIKRASSKIEQTMFECLKNELSELKDQLREARENRFGRRIFEAVAEEYLSSYLNEGSKIRVLSAKLDESKQQLENTKSQLTEQAKLVEQVQRKAKLSEDRNQRQQILNRLCSPLGTEKRAMMEELLENTRTDLLDSAYKKYLPSVLKENVTNSSARPRSNPPSNGGAAAMITNKTGDRTRINLSESSKVVNSKEGSENSDIDYLKRLAGIPR